MATTSTKKSSPRKKTATRATATTRKKTSVPERKKAGARRTAGAGTNDEGSRKYSPAVGESVRTELEEMKAGKLRSGRSGTMVTDRKQAIAIGLSEARRAGEKVPPNPTRRRHS